MRAITEQKKKSKSKLGEGGGGLKREKSFMEKKRKYLAGAVHPTSAEIEKGCPYSTAYSSFRRERKDLLKESGDKGALHRKENLNAIGFMAGRKSKGWEKYQRLGHTRSTLTLRSLKGETD